MKEAYDSNLLSDTFDGEVIEFYGRCEVYSEGKKILQLENGNVNNNAAAQYIESRGIHSL